MHAPALTFVPDVHPSHRHQTMRRLLVSTKLVMVLISLACCSSLLGQENFLVATQDGTLSLYDLTTYMLIESFQGGPFTYTMTAGPNPRLAFSAGGAGFGAAIDTTIGRNVATLSRVRAPASTMGLSGKYYLAADYNYVLDVVDAATLALVRTVDFSSIIPRLGNPGTIVAANGQAYIFPRGQNPSAPKAAVVNLNTFQLSSIALPAGTFCRRCLSRTPDGSMVIALERESSDNKLHAILINTTTNTVIGDYAQTTNYAPSTFAMTRSSDPAKLYGYAATVDSVIALDFVSGSPTYGQILPNTKVTLPNLSPIELAVSSDGSKLIIGGDPSVAPPAPNVDVVDSAKMLSDPNNALLNQLTVNGGISMGTVCDGMFVSTPPNSAPTVTGASGDITNNKDNDIQVTGTNFQQGALVRIGSLGPLQTTFIDSTTLMLTVPNGMPAGRAQDIIVTNPMTNSPPNQQNQSGLLAGQFNIFPNPNFQPGTQFATSNQASLYVYDLKQQTMLNVPTGFPGDVPYGLAFNVDGKYLYLAVEQGYSGGFYALPVNLSTNMHGSPISLPSNTYFVAQNRPLAAGNDPLTNSPVIYVAYTDNTDLHVAKIDSDPSSGNFNTIVQTFNAGLNSSYPFAETITLSPDGKYAYVWYSNSQYYMGIFNLVSGAFTSIRYDALRVSSFQYQIGISPDGKSLLLSNNRGNRTSIRVFDISNPISPKPLTEITPLPISGLGFPFMNNYQVIGSKLYAIDLNGAIVVFNFDRSKGDFRERGYAFGGPNKNSGYSNYAFSADGAYIYVVDYFQDLVLVVDVSKVTGGQDPRITNIRSPYAPYVIDVSPVAPPAKPVQQRQTKRAPRRSDIGAHNVFQP